MKQMLMCLAFAFCSLVAVAQSPGTICNKSAILSTSTSGVQQIIAAPANPTPQSVHVCDVYFDLVQGATPANFGLVYGTGSNCGTGQANLTAQWIGVASSFQGFVQEPGPSAALFVPNNNAVCFDLTAAPTGAAVQVLYAIY